MWIFFMALPGNMMVFKFVAKLRQKTVTGLVKSINERLDSLFTEELVFYKGYNILLKLFAIIRFYLILFNKYLNNLLQIRVL